MSAIYHKTAKGTEAIAKRSRDLAGRMRSLLILVDGKRTQQELETLAAGFGDIAMMIEQLHQAGLIDESKPQAGPASADNVNPTPLPAAAPVSLAQAKSMAVRLLMEILGPNAQAMCLRIEDARTLPEYIDAVKRAHSMVREIRGAEQAQRFGDGVEANLPSA